MRGAKSGEKTDRSKSDSNIFVADEQALSRSYE